jgi:predicted transcriptional regulator
MNANKLSRNKLNILQKISEFGFITIDSFFPKNYAYSNLSRKIFDLDNENLDRNKLSHSLSKLKQYGLIQRAGPKKKSIWHTTKLGQQFVEDAFAKKK